MKVFSSISELRRWRSSCNPPKSPRNPPLIKGGIEEGIRKCKGRGRACPCPDNKGGGQGGIGFVPTMGAFHEGHLALMRKARKECNAVVVSIFVNPTQFGPGEDFKRYPRNLKKDLTLAEQEGMDAVFLPSVREMYPKGFSTYIQVEGSETAGMCSPHRPGHFKGVATVVLKLFNIIQPQRAYFGEKDYQQLKVIQRMVKNLNLPVKIVPVPTVRENNGLAMSSRNAYLSQVERKNAASLYDALNQAKKMIHSGETQSRSVVNTVKKTLPSDAVIDYIEVCEPETLAPVKIIKGNVLLGLAVRIGKTRLIDNMVVKKL